MRFRKAQACRDCHFLIKELPTQDPVHHPYQSHVTPEERRSLTNNDYGWVTGDYFLRCSMGVWDEGYGTQLEERRKTIVETNRRSYCFFWPFRPGMFLQAAETLQRREWELAEARRDRMLTIVGLWIAAVALVADLLWTAARSGSQ